MYKRYLLLFPILLTSCRFPGVDQHERDGKPVNPWQPSATGCTCTISANANDVDAMTWTNAVNGHHGTGTTSMGVEFGSSFAIFTDPSINCSTNVQTVAYASFKCHGTNMPFAVPIAMQPNCNGVLGSVNGDCNNCSFSVTLNTNAFWCNIYAPTK